jgi:hypothetical protein
MMQRFTRAAIATAAISLLVLGGTGAAQAAPAIPLTTGQEVMDIDSEAHGFFTYDLVGTTFCYTLEVDDLTTTTVAAHVHVGPRNVNGPVVIPLATMPATSFEIGRTCTTISQMLADDITENPKAYYVNVHTMRYPGGEVRGQLK